MFYIGTLLILLGAVVPAGSTEGHPFETCTEQGTVRFETPRMEIRAALRSIGEQAHMNIAVRTNVRGVVTTPTECVKPRVALRVLLSQVGAGFCDEGDVIYVSRSRRGCRGVLVLPAPNSYVGASPED